MARTRLFPPAQSGYRGLGWKAHPMADPREPKQSRATPSIHRHGDFGTRPFIALARA